MTSIFENTHSKVTIHILHDDTLTDENRQKFIHTAEKYSQGLELHDISAHKDILNDPRIDYARNRYSVGALFRLFIPEMMPELDRVIYLDCDVLCNRDIADLWNIDVHDYAMAGGIDLPELNGSIYREKMRLVLNGCRPETYINSGVLLMNLARIRERGVLSQMCIDWLARRGEMALAADQDALNSIFAGDIKILDSTFNQNILIPDMSGCIIHTLFGKPWRNMRGLQSDRIYWKMYLRSAWGENVTCEELVDVLNDAAVTVRHTKSKFRRAYNFIKDRVIGRVIPFRTLHYIRIEIAVRFRQMFTRS